MRPLPDTVGIVLAAGLGTRLRPATDRCPKPLLPVAGIEPLFFALRSLHRLGVRRAVVNAHHLAGRIAAALGEWRPLLPGLETRLSVEEPAPLGTGGALLKILREQRDWFGAGTGVLVINGDTIAGIDLRRVVGDGRADTFAASPDPRHLARYGALLVGPDGAWTGLARRNATAAGRPLHFLGVHHFSAATARALRDSPAAVVPADVFDLVYRPRTDAGARLRAVLFCDDGGEGADFWHDVNTPAFLLEAQRSLLGLPAWGGILAERHPGVRELRPGVWVRGFRGEGGGLAPPVVAIAEGEAGDAPAAGPNAAVVVRGAGRWPGGAPARIEDALLVIEGDGTPALPALVKDTVLVV